MKRILAAVAVVAALGLSACGSSSSTFTCCLNGKAFTCPTADDASKCSTACSANPSKDAPAGSMTCKD
ncbi:MAG: hypothetical protein ACYC8T_36415 [Myxococcaceae bacterium]